MSAANTPEEATERRAPTRRAMAKQQTRSRVLAAARKLFSEHGYERATIRDIAAAAEMSTGAVFANFADKSDLFREILVADVAKLTAAMRKAGDAGGDVDDSLLQMFRVGYTFYLHQLPLARAAFSFAWSPPGPMFTDGANGGGLATVFPPVLEAAVARGELRRDEISLRAEMLREAYLANFPRLIFQGATLESVLERSRAQIDVLLASARSY